MQDKLAAVFGGSGFLGRYVAGTLASIGWRVRAASRRPYLAGPCSRWVTSDRSMASKPMCVMPTRFRALSSAR